MIANGSIKGIEDPEVKTFAKLTANFSFELYSELNKGQANLFYSPYFILSSLCCLSNGAREDTFKEFCRILKQNIQREQLNTVFSTTLSKFNSTRKRYAYVKENKTENRTVDWKAANLLYLPKDIIVDKEFSELVSKIYNVNFFTQFSELSGEDIRLKINDWGRDKSKKKIKELMKKGQFPDPASLIMTNVVYFKGDWEKEFDKDNTCEDEFQIDAKRSVKVPIMMQMNVFKCLETKLFSVMELPILGNNLSMLIYLPKEPENLAELENCLSYDVVEQCVEKMKYYSMMVYLPAFRLDMNIDLIEPLKKLGFDFIFDSKKADFSGICKENPVHVSSLIYHSNIEVGEDGTDWMQNIQLPKESEGIVKEFNVNRPFIFIIRHNETGCIMFTGKVVDPSELPLSC